MAALLEVAGAGDLVLAHLRHGGPDESPDATAKDIDEAARLVRETIATCERAKDEWRLMYAMEVGAQVDAARGRIEPALKGFEAVIERGEQYRFQSSNTETRSTLTTTVRSRNEASGARIGDSSNDAPSPAGVQ